MLTRYYMGNVNSAYVPGSIAHTQDECVAKVRKLKWDCDAEVEVAMYDIDLRVAHRNPEEWEIIKRLFRDEGLVA